MNLINRVNKSTRAKDNRLAKQKKRKESTNQAHWLL